jgi:hypothetical protein
MLAHRRRQCVVGFRVTVRKKRTTAHSYMLCLSWVGRCQEVKSGQAKSGQVRPAEQIPQRSGQDMVGEATFRLPVVMWPCRDT